jgi:hypothetical protein
VRTTAGEISKSRIGPQKVRPCLLLAPLFELWPALLFPAFDGLFVPLVGPTHRLLQGETKSPDQPTHVRRVVAHPELSSNHLGYPLAGPHLLSEFVRWGSLGQRSFQLLPWCSLKRGSVPGEVRFLKLFTPPSRPRFIHWLTAPSVTPRA